MTEQANSPLRRRMIEDMTIRKFAQKTQHDYVQRAKEFASHLQAIPDTAEPEDVCSASDVQRRRHAEDQRHPSGHCGSHHRETFLPGQQPKHRPTPLPAKIRIDTS
jgi:hypothetical protein